jgi:XTP/dITP diphosphohydrolase
VKRQILIATTNRGKAAELAAMLEGLGVEWMSLGDYPDIPEVVEDGETFAENARKKACDYARATGLWTVADDSGLVIDVLDGAPGIKSARFSGEKEDGADRQLLDHRNMAKVLRLMNNVPDDKRTARFVCCVCLASPAGVLAETSGTLEGRICKQETGENGFGYDPIFLLEEMRRTAAQLTADEKNTLSHRFKAIDKLRVLLPGLLKDR